MALLAMRKFHLMILTTRFIGSFSSLVNQKREIFELLNMVFILGVICMMPWDMMTTLNGFWMYKFRNVTLDDIHYVPLNR